MNVLAFINTLVENILTEISTGFFLFLGGYLTSKLLTSRKQNDDAKFFEDSVQAAANIIYDAEQKFTGTQRGAEKLNYAVKRFVEETGCKDYQMAQNYIVQVFNMTRLSEPDFPIKRN